MFQLVDIVSIFKLKYNANMRNDCKIKMSTILNQSGNSLPRYYYCLTTVVKKF